MRSRASCLRSSRGRRRPAPISNLIKQWIGSPFSSMRGGLIGFALYSKKACSLINPFDAGALNVIRLGRSLCFFYAKQVPFAETNERILVGVGRVSAMGRLREYVKGDPNGFGAWVWERSVIHSIRAPDFTDGFLLPYQALMEKAATDPS